MKTTIDIADPIRFARFQIRGFGFNSVNEFGVGQKARKGVLDALIEIPFLAAILIKRHQRIDICSACRPPEGMCCQVRNDLARACSFVVRVRGGVDGFSHRSVHADNRFGQRNRARLIVASM